MSPLPSLHYGPDTTIVFDGYEEGPSIKGNTNQRRGRNVHHVVSFTAQRELSGNKEDFLSRDTNKQRLIQMISDQLRERDCIVVNAHSDADVDIVNLFNTLRRSLEKTRIYLSYSSTIPRERLWTSISDLTSPKRMALLKCITTIVFKR